MMKPGDALGDGALESSCDLVQAQLGEYKAGLLLPAQAQQLAAHLATCDTCTQDAAFDRVFQLAVPSLPVATPPPALFEQIALATYAAPPRRTFREIVLSYLAPPATRLALGTAFAVGIATLVVPRFSLPSDPVMAPPIKRAERQPSVKVPAVKQETPTTPVMPTTIAQTRVPAVKTSAPRPPQVSTLAPNLPTPSTTVAVTTGTPTRPPVQADKSVKANPSSPVKAAPTATMIARVDKTDSVLKAPSHKAGPNVSPTLTHALVVSKNPAPLIAEHTPAKELPADVPTTTPVEPDMEHATKVAVATMPERTIIPGTSSNGAGEVVNPGFKFSFGAASGQVARKVLDKQSAQDAGGTAKTVSVVSAPAKL